MTVFAVINLQTKSNVPSFTLPEDGAQNFLMCHVIVTTAIGGWIVTHRGAENARSENARPENARPQNNGPDSVT